MGCSVFGGGLGFLEIAVVNTYFRTLMFNSKDIVSLVRIHCFLLISFY